MSVCGAPSIEGPRGPEAGGAVPGGYCSVR